MISNQDRSLHGVITEAMKSAKLEPVKFDKPLKSIGAQVRFYKEFQVKSILDAHKAIGWMLGILRNYFGKHLYDIKEISVKNLGSVVTIEATVYMSYLTFEDDHEAWLDDQVEQFRKFPGGYSGYFWSEPEPTSWDSAERTGSIHGFTQMDGGGPNAFVAQKVDLSDD